LAICKLDGPGRMVQSGWVSESCSICGGPIERVSLALCKRSDDGALICKRVVMCGGRAHVTWRWVDRPDSPIERDDSLTFVFRK